MEGTDDLMQRVRERDWYHAMRFGDHVTHGMFDLVPYIPKYGIPERLDGKRVLEVGTWDGFWAFELERRGAEVVALDLDDEQDLDWPPRRRPQEWSTIKRGDGFRLAKEIYGSRVERVDRSIYFATPDELGQFDLVFCGSVLIHLRDQLLALERIAALTKPGGMFVSAEEYDRRAGLTPWPSTRYLADRDKAVVYWLPSKRTWRRMMWTAGFDRIERFSRFDMRSSGGWSVRHVVHHAFK